jgi:tellurite methyltransferase
MSQLDRDKWNQRYAEDSYRRSNPVTLVSDWLPRIPVGRALDVACGAGRNALLMARSGFQVDAIDISFEGLKLAHQQAASEGLEINWIEQDFDEAWTCNCDYDLIIVMWYVNLALIQRLVTCLAPGGYLICEEHLVSAEEVIGPANTSFRVSPGALRDAVAGLDILLYEESVEATPEGQQVASARVVARKV